METKLYPKKQKQPNSQCPNCGAEINYHSQFENVLAGGFDNSDQGAWSVTSFKPTRKADLIADVAVPVVQASVLALLAIPTSSMALIAMNYEWYLSLPISSVFMFGLTIRNINRLEKERGESKEFSYEPVEGGGVGLGPAQKKGKISLEVVLKDDDFKAAMKIVDLPDGVSAKQFVEFSRSILAGKSLARKDWAGGGKEFSRDQYDGLVAAMLSAGLIMTAAGKGKVLTAGGKRAIARMVRTA